MADCATAFLSAAKNDTHSRSSIPIFSAIIWFSVFLRASRNWLLESRLAAAVLILWNFFFRTTPGGRLIALADQNHPNRAFRYLSGRPCAAVHLRAGNRRQANYQR